MGLIRMSTGRPLRWISRDGWLIILARGLRTFGQAFVILLTGIYLKDHLGLSLLHFGLFLGVASAGSAFTTFLVALVGDSLGRRRLLVGFTLLGVAGALTVAFTDQFLVLAAVAALGSFPVALAGGEGPVLVLEQAAVPDTAPAERRTDLFAVMSITRTAFAALGSLAVGLPVLLTSQLGISELASFRVMYVGYAALLVVGAGLYLLMSSSIEVSATIRRAWSNPMQLRARRSVFSMAGIFGVDELATRMVAPGLVALWFYTRFGVELNTIAPIFFFAHVLTATSMWVAAKLANRFGLLNTMVFTHLPAVLMGMAMPFLPSLGIAGAVWVARGFFAQMDVPTKASYMMGVVPADERSAMAGMTNVGRSIGGTVGLSVAGVLWSFAAAVPFLTGGALKLVYLGGLYTMFRNVKPPEERRQ